MDERKISIVIPTWERDDVLFESFAQILPDERIESVFISDDASDIGVFKSVSNKIAVLNQLHENKIIIQRNANNRDCFFNKYISVLGAKTAWIILGDSDNVFGVYYLDKIFSIENWEEDTIYTPCFAAPNFDFRAYSGLTITKENVAEYIDKPLFEVALNACNYFVNRDAYLALNIWNDLDPVTSDSIYVCMKWLQAGNKIKIVDGLQYFHRVWENSHYQKNVGRTEPGFHESILQQLRQLK